jgi:hypothetical protein
LKQGKVLYLLARYGFGRAGMRFSCPFSALTPQQVTTLSRLARMTGAQDASER